MGESCDEDSNLCFAGNCPVTALTCSTALKSKLLMKDNVTDDSRDKLVWKWGKGAATMVDDFADPTMTATYALCLYAGSTASLIGRAEVQPSGSLWRVGSKGYTYKDKAGTSGGVTRLKLKAGAANTSQAQVIGKGANLSDFTLPIASIDLPVIVQLRNSDTGMCWGSTFAMPRKNDGKVFNARVP